MPTMLDSRALLGLELMAEWCRAFRHFLETWFLVLSDLELICLEMLADHCHILRRAPAIRMLCSIVIRPFDLNITASGLVVLADSLRQLVQASRGRVHVL